MDACTFNMGNMIYLFIRSNVTVCTCIIGKKVFIIFSARFVLHNFFYLFFYFVKKAAELVSLNLAEYEAHFLDIRCYLEQKLLVSPVSVFL